MEATSDIPEEEIKTAPFWLYITSTVTFVVFSLGLYSNTVGHENFTVSINLLVVRVCCDTPETIAFWGGVCAVLFGALAAWIQFSIGRELLTRGDSIGAKVAKGNCVTLLSLLAFSWPLNLWLAATLLAHWGFKRCDKDLKAAKNPDFLFSLLFRVNSNLLTWSLLIGAGLVPLCLAQIGFNVLATISSDYVFKAQMTLIDVKTFLATYSTLSLGGLFILLLVAIVFRQYELVASVFKAKAYVGRTIIVLTAITSFSFVAISLAEPVWVGRIKAEFSDELLKITQIQRELVATVWLKEVIEDLDSESTKDLQGLIHELHTFHGGTTSTGKSVEKQEVVRAVAARLASTAPQAKMLNAATDQSETDTKGLSGAILPNLQILEKVRRWISSGVQLSQYRPSISDLKALRSTKIDMDASLKQSQSVVGEVFKSKLGVVATAGLDPLSQTFVKELISALTKQTLDTLFVKGVNSFATAAVWLKQQKGFLGFSPTDWKWDLRRGQPKDLSPNAAMKTLLTDITTSMKPTVGEEQDRNVRGGGSKLSTRIPSHR